MPQAEVSAAGPNAGVAMNGTKRETEGGQRRPGVVGDGMGGTREDSGYQAINARI